jgi:hypothetical protein
MRPLAVTHHIHVNSAWLLYHLNHLNFAADVALKPPVFLDYQATNTTVFHFNILGHLITQKAGGLCALPD